MHQPVISILHALDTLSEDIIILPQLLEKRQTFFCKDNIHLNRYGAKTLFYRIQDLVSLIAKFFSEKRCDLHDLKKQLSEHFTSIESRVVDRASFSRLREPVDQIFDKKFYPYQPSGKKMAFWFSNKRLANRGKYPLGHLDRQLLIVFNTTSMFRDFICKSKFSTKKRKRITLFPVPCGITVSPGGSCFHIQNDVTNSRQLRCVTPSAYISVIYIGSNEKSALYDLVMRFLCENNLFANGCIICGKGQQPRNKFYLGHSKQDFLEAFLSLIK